ncbi:MAG TPA: hypothetical protein VL989_00170 [Candidatus Sulfotelmatobacter sp.]|nr:hypothetical protein [Candidatus Sulfotelmatobacter sp.]
MNEEHPKVRRPQTILHERREKKKSKNRIYFANDQFLEWVTNHVLASVLLFDIALIVPLLAIPANNTIKITLGVISGSWIQWWALPALQRSQNKIQAQNDAKAEVDHETLTYLARLQDEQMIKLDLLDRILKKIEK